MMSPPRILISACLAVGLAACGGQQSESPAPAPEPVETPAPAPVETPPPTAAAEPAEPAGPDMRFAALPAPYNAADYDRGRRTWRLCSTCHLTDPDAGHRVGPNLAGMFGQQVGTAEGFTYSPALLEADFLWTPEVLDEWLANPREFLPGNRMSFAGVRREDDRHAVIAYLMVESGWQPSGE